MGSYTLSSNGRTGTVSDRDTEIENGGENKFSDVNQSISSNTTPSCNCTCSSKTNGSNVNEENVFNGDEVTSKKQNLPCTPPNSKLEPTTSSSTSGRSHTSSSGDKKESDSFSLHTPVSDKEVMLEIFDTLRSVEGVYTIMKVGKRIKANRDQENQAIQGVENLSGVSTKIKVNTMGKYQNEEKLNAYNLARQNLKVKLPMPRHIPCTHRFSILTFNDVYELLASHDGHGGLANMHTLMHQEIEKLEEEGAAWISTLNGDFLSASLLAPKFQGKHMIDVLNSMPLTHISIGNHEFDFHSATETSDIVLLKRIKESNARWINSNIFRHKQLFPETIPKEIITLQNEEGLEVRIGLFALCTGATRILSFPPDFVEFENPVSVAKQMVKVLKDEDNCDIVIALTHLPVSQDLLLATSVPGIDLILGGHDHMPISQQQGGTTIIKCGQNAKFLGRIDLYINKQIIDVNGESVATLNYLPEWKLLGNFGYEPHPNTKAVVDKYIGYLPSDWNEFLGICAQPLDSTTSLCRSTETTMCSLLADALRHHYNSDIALINGGTCRGDRTYNKGYKITKGDMYVEFPFESYPRYGVVTGAQLVGSLEDGLKNIGVGGFPHVSSGLSITYDPSGPPGSRIVAICFHGEEIDLEREYTVVSTDWLFMGGDGYKHLTKGRLISHEEDQYYLREHAIRWIKNQKFISIKLEGRIAKL